MKCLYGISIHSPLRGETIHICANASIPFISIHLLRAEQDPIQFGPPAAESKNISIHLLRAEQDGHARPFAPSSKAFQSTCSVRSKTQAGGFRFRGWDISIHLLRAEQDDVKNRLTKWGGYFNPLAPCGARPRATRASTRTRYFNPLAPCGARRDEGKIRVEIREFQSTCSVRSKTLTASPDAYALVTSIHLLRVEQDLGQRDEVVVDADFNPLAPCGARRDHGDRKGGIKYFNPLAPCGARRRR